MTDTAPVPTAAASSRRRLAPILPALAVALAAFAWLSHANQGFIVTDDGVRDQLMVRDCTDLGRCHLIGPPTSLAGFHHGPVWLDLLIAVRLLGGDTASQRVVILALLALGVATLFVVVWRWLRPSMALPAAVLLAGALGLDGSVSLLTSPSVAAFPDIITTAGLLCYGLSGRRRYLIASAFALGLGINVHVGSLILIPALLAMAALARPRAWREVLVAGLVLAVTCVMTSSAALRANMLGFAEHGRLWPALAGGLLVVVLCARVGPRFRRASWDGRAWIVGAVFLLPFALASVWLMLWQRHHFGFIYLHPILGPAAACAAGLLVLPFEVGARRWRPLRWIPTTAAVTAIALGAVLVVWTSTVESAAGESNVWTLAQAAALSDWAAARGWSHEELVFHLQGPACRELLAAMSIIAPLPGAERRPDNRQLQVVKGRREALASLGDRADIVSIGPTTVAAVREIDSWLRLQALTACRRPTDSGRAPQCAPASPRSAEVLRPDRFLFTSRSFPAIHDLTLVPPYIASYEIPLAPVAGETRELALAEPTSDDGWLITRAEGVRIEGQLPARRVRLHSESGAPGAVVIERAFPVTPDMRYPPCVFEAAPGDPLQALAVNS